MVLKSGLNKIKELNIEIDVKTRAKLEIEVFDRCVDLYYDSAHEFRLWENSSVVAWENSCLS